jgi:Ala-tRNA(Pro) deacylase
MPTFTVAAALEEAHARYDAIPHTRTETAAAEARAVGADPAEVGKTVIVAGPDGNVRAVVPSSERVDLRKLAELLGVRRGELHLLTEQQLAWLYPEFELGAVPPFGGPSDRVVVDRRLARRASVVLEAGTHEESLRLATDDLVAVVHPLVGDICRD